MLTNGQAMNFLEAFSGLKNLTFYQRREDEGLDFVLPHRLHKWMERNEPSLWDNYIFRCGAGDKSYAEWLNAILNPSNLARFLIEQRDSWENVQDESRIVGYKHKAAEYLDSINKKEA